MFLIFQIGAREHYAIPRALHASGELAGLFTDFWVPPGHFFGRLPGARRLRDRWHADLAKASVHAPNGCMLAFELKQRLAGKSGWDAILARNELFQQWAVRELAKVSDQGPSIPSRSAPMGTRGTARRSSPTVFSYSYAARDIFRHAKARGWRTVLGQIDPGPEEERIVATEGARYHHLASAWQPAPASYWETWREELALADRILVNSDWSRQCLLREGVPDEKMQVVPLVYQVGTDLSIGPTCPPTAAQGRSMQWADLEKTNPPIGGPAAPDKVGRLRKDAPTRLLFLGQINLRKGVARLLDAMRLLQDEPVELTLAGPSEIDPAAWADLPRVRWIGPVPRSEVGRHYPEADLFMLPTLSDGFAITQLEAMAHGLPVMASKHCGAAVTHGRNGWILEDLEPETIAAAIRMAMHERLPDVRPPEFSLDDLAAILKG